MQKQILILEDDPHIGFVLDLFLSSQGFQVSLCTTIVQLQREADSKPPDIFLLDIMVPDGNGLSFCNTLKQDSRKKHIPVLLMSAHIDPGSLDQKASHDDFIAKPFDLDTLAKTLKKHLYE